MNIILHHAGQKIPTLFISRQAKVAVPSGNQNHIIGEILTLDFSLLKDYNIGFENVEHGLEAVSKRSGIVTACSGL